MTADDDEAAAGEPDDQLEEQDQGHSRNTDIGTADTMRDRADESRAKLWLLLQADRLVITALLSGIVFGTLLVVGAVEPDLLARLESGDTKATVFSTTLGAVVTATTLVVTISQLVVSQENGPLGDQHERMSNTMDFREYAEELYDGPPPADPSAFLQGLVDEANRRAVALQESVGETDDEALVAEIGDFTESVIGNAQAVQEQLEGAKFGSFDVLFAALNFNYSWKIFQTERIADDYAATLDGETETRLAELRTALTMFGPAREHIKTLYFQWALINLSQLIVYAAVPAILASAGMLIFFGTGPISGTTLGVSNLLLTVAGAFTISMTPFLLLLAYVSRIATVAKRTLAIGPLILRESQR
ncbi:MAG: hypothetical protein ABEJ35_07620 [Halobacteriaceae archaeon]